MKALAWQRRKTKFSPPGLGSAITPAPAIWHAAARKVAGEMGGKFPDSVAEGLRQLPGVGGYTSGAIAAIAYDELQAAMDANAERVIARLFAVETRLPKAKTELHRHAMTLVPERAGDFAQVSLMPDLGSAICTPKRPACAQCPLQKDCLARKRGIQESLPIKAPKAARPLKRGAAFVVRDKFGAVLLVKRPDKGLLASMLEPPLGPWEEKFPSKERALNQAPFVADWVKRAGIVRHGFTHFELEMEVYFAEVSKSVMAALEAAICGMGGSGPAMTMRKQGGCRADDLRERRAAHGDAQDRRTRAGCRRPAVRGAAATI